MEGLRRTLKRGALVPTAKELKEIFERLIQDKLREKPTPIAIAEIREHTPQTKDQGAVNVKQPAQKYRGVIEKNKAEAEKPRNSRENRDRTENGHNHEKEEKINRGAS